MKTYSVIIIGAGNRGSNYSRKLDVLRDRYKVVAVAEPVEGRRNYVKELYDLPDDMCFASWQDILSRPKLADIAIVATMDNEHYEPAMKAIELGYNLLLEKPVAPTPQQCADIANAAKAKGVEVLVCHVLRYTPFYKRVKELVLDGTIGEIVSVVAATCIRATAMSVATGTARLLLPPCCWQKAAMIWTSSSGWWTSLVQKYLPSAA